MENTPPIESGPCRSHRWPAGIWRSRPEGGHRLCSPKGRERRGEGDERAWSWLGPGAPGPVDPLGCIGNPGRGTAIAVAAAGAPREPGSPGAIVCARNRDAGAIATC